MGSIEKDRISLYLDKEDNLCFRVIDRNSETYTLKIPHSEKVALNKLYYLNFEVGIGEKHSFLKFFVNGQLVEKTEIDHAIALSPIDLKGAVIGADLNGNNSAKFDFGEELIFQKTMTSEQRHEVSKFLLRVPDQWLSFQGDQWMRVSKEKVH